MDVKNAGMVEACGLARSHMNNAKSKIPLQTLSANLNHLSPAVSLLLAELGCALEDAAEPLEESLEEPLEDPLEDPLEKEGPGEMVVMLGAVGVFAAAWKCCPSVGSLTSPLTSHEPAVNFGQAGGESDGE